MYTDVTVQKVNDWLDDCNLQLEKSLIGIKFRVYGTIWYIICGKITQI